MCLGGRSDTDMSRNGDKIAIENRNGKTEAMEWNVQMQR